MIRRTLAISTDPALQLGPIKYIGAYRIPMDAQRDIGCSKLAIPPPRPRRQ